MHGIGHASAKALRTIQQVNLPTIDPTRRVLGVIRPTAECISQLTQTRHVGILATSGTIKSESYNIEINKLFPDITVVGEACPMWVPLVENNEYNSKGSDYFVQKHINQILADATGKPIETIRLDTERDNFMSAEEAKEYGLVDAVIASH